MPPANTRLRWYQFSLRTLLAVLIGGSIGAIAFVVRAERQRLAVRGLQDAGLMAAYEYDRGSDRRIKIIQPSGPSWQRGKFSIHYFADIRAVWGEGGELTDPRHLADLPDLELLVVNDGQFADDDLQYLRGLSRLKVLELDGSPFSGSGLENIAGMRQLEVLSLGGTNLNSGARHLAGLERLRTLNLSGTKITDEALPWLGRLKSMESLDLSQTAVTDAGLRSLVELPRLQILSLAGTQISDPGLDSLGRLKGLRILDLRGTRVTGAGLSLTDGNPRLKELYLFGVSAPRGY